METKISYYLYKACRNRYFGNVVSELDKLIAEEKKENTEK